MVLENLEIKSQELFELINLTLLAAFSVLELAKENLELQTEEYKDIDQAESYLFTLDAVMYHLKISSDILKKLDFYHGYFLTKSKLEDDNLEKYVITNKKSKKNNKCTIFSLNEDINIYVEKNISVKDIFN